MSKVRAVVITVALIAAPALAGCGEDEEASGTAAPTATPTAAATATDALPADLAGAWKVTIRPSDVRSAPADIRGKTSQWEIEFHATGGSEDGPSMTVETAEHETFVLPISVSGEQLAIEDFVACRNLTYAIEGQRLTFEPSHDSCVRDHTLPAVLAARPWQRAQ